MFRCKRVMFPTKLSKITYAMVIIITIFVIFFRLNSKHESNEEITELKVNFNTSNKLHQFSYKSGIKYILHWINTKNRPIESDDGSLLFSKRHCAWNNCYLTEEHVLFEDLSRFSIILFNGLDLEYFQNSNSLPRRRFTHQKYVYMNEESAATYPICEQRWNNFFNWTWTYKLDSDLVWNYFVIKDKKGSIIGPRENIHWIKVRDMDAVDTKFLMKLRSKTKIAAWFVSNCKTQSLREEFVSELQGYLDEYNLEIDIYGECGKYICPKILMSRCHKMLEKEYFFYLAFEDAFSEDFVTEIILHALHHDTVPVVFGGANYSRFLPDGSYLNALEYGPERLARRMLEIMQNISVYQKFFRWRQHYSYHAYSEVPETDNYCRLCAMANNRTAFNAYSVNNNITFWWTPKEKC